MPEASRGRGRGPHPSSPFAAQVASSIKTSNAIK